MAIVAVSVAPLGTGSPSVSRYVARAEKVLRGFGKVKHRLDPMFATLQGDLRDCLEVARRMHEAVFEEGALRVSTVIKIDDRRDKEADMGEKVRVVEEILRESP